ncbi:MAG TPA: ABC transporter permease [Herpetosiphonaceae bacterium]|nr:ABC transporter permease [Herpetosiphonaceae bacterium]
MSGLSAAWRYLVDERATVLRYLGEHVQITLITLAVSILFAVPLGVLLVRVRWLSAPVLGLLSILYTIPSLALLILFIPFLGLGADNAIATLIIYAQVILVRNTVVGLQSVSPALLEAATGMGMSGWTRWWRVELPLALPLILAGVRVAAVTVIGIAAIAAQVNAGGLGTLLFYGIQLDRDDMIWAGVFVVGALALAVNGGMLALEKALVRTPRG